MGEVTPPAWTSKISQECQFTTKGISEISLISPTPQIYPSPTPLPTSPPTPSPIFSPTSSPSPPPSLTPSAKGAMGNLLLASLANSWQKLLAGNLINNWIFFFILFVIGVILLRFSLFEGPRVFFGTFGILGTLAIFLASFFMPLPFVEQLRLELPRWFSLFFGIIFLVAGLIVILLSIISLKIKVATSLEKLSKIVSGGIYSFLRHPLYSGLLLAYLGWALIFNSILTLLCFPIAFLLLLILSFLEEKDLLRIYGPLYREYQKKIRWRFLPYII